MKIKAEFEFNPKTGKVTKKITPFKKGSDLTAFVKFATHIQQFAFDIVGEAVDYSQKKSPKNTVAFGAGKKIVEKSRGPIIKDNLKRCPKCNRWKDLEEFARDLNKPSGRASWCKVCVRTNQDRELMRKRARAWYRKNREKALAYARQYSERKKDAKHNNPDSAPPTQD